MSEKKRKLSEILAEKVETVHNSQRLRFRLVISEYKDTLTAMCHERAAAGMRFLVIPSGNKGEQTFVDLFEEAELYGSLVGGQHPEEAIAKVLADMLEVDVTFSFGHEMRCINPALRKTFRFSW